MKGRGHAAGRTHYMRRVFAHVVSWAYHEREDDGRGLDALDVPHDHRTDELDGGEAVDAGCLDVADVHVVRLILGRHQQQQNTLDVLTQAPHNQWPTQEFGKKDGGSGGLEKLYSFCLSDSRRCIWNFMHFWPAGVPVFFRQRRRKWRKDFDLSSTRLKLKRKSKQVTRTK